MSDAPTPDARTWRRRSQLAGGIALICVLFVAETWNAHRVTPHPASPVIWAVLGTLGLGAAAAAAVFAQRARRAEAAARREGVEPS